MSDSLEPMSFDPPSEPKEERAGSPRRLMDVYLDDAGSYKLMNAEEERAQAHRIAELRTAYWKALLSRPSLVEQIVEIARKQLPAEDFPHEEVERVMTGLAALRSRRNDAAARDFDRELDALATALSKADTDRLAADAIADDLDVLVAGGAVKHLVGVEIDRTLVAYQQRVRRARASLLSVRNRFVCANLRLVVRVAQRYGRNRMPLSDRVQEGNLGLMKAVDRYDPERGTRFSTYAAWWIRHAITRALVNRGRNVRIPAHLHTVFTKMTGAERSLRGKLGREPTLEEIAAVIKVPVDKVRLAKEAMEMRSEALDTPACGEDSRPASEVIEAPLERSVDETMDDRRNGAIARNALAKLDPMERDIIEHRFGLRGAKKLTLQKLGERYSLSRERIRQVQNRALEKLREIVEASPLPATAFS